MQIRVLKLGGGEGVDHGAALENLAARIQQGERWIVLHGASAATNALAQATNTPIRTITGPGGHESRHTDLDTIRLYSMATASVNQGIAARLDALNVRAVGLAGPTVLRAERKKAIRALVNGRQIVIRDDYSGTLHSIDTRLLHTLLDAGYTPVIAPLALGQEGEHLNVDGDLAAALAAQATGAQLLLILTNVPGLLRDVSDPGSLVSQIDLARVDAFEQMAQGRMKKKLLAARQASTQQTILASSRVPAPIDAALGGGGTHITRT